MTTYGLIAAVLLAQAQPAPVPQGEPAPGLRTAPQPPLMALPTLTLDDALREADKKNLDLKVAQARLAQSQELHWKAWSAYLPQVTAGATALRNNFADVTVDATTLGAPAGTPPIVIQKQHQVTAQARVNQAIFAPQAIYGIAAARAGERLATDSTEGARQDILFGVVQAYYGAAGLRQVVTIQERQLAIAQDHEKDARVRYDAGTTPKVTLLRAEIDRARAEQDLKRAQNSYVAAKISLATLLDRRDPDFEVRVPESPVVPQDGALDQAAERDRPDVKAAGEQITVAEKNRNGVVMRYLPTLGAFGQYQYQNAAGFTGETRTWFVGLSLNWNLIDGFLRESDLRESNAKLYEAEVARASTLARARDEVARARLDLDSAVANRQKAKEQLDLSRENQRLVNVNYRAGAATYIEVSDANTQLNTAELTQVSESLNADLAAMRLLKAAGVFNPKY
jgi:outer membrane protein TolC